MQLQPKDLYTKLEFDKVLELLEKECLGELGKEKIRQLKPDTNIILINGKLREAAQYKALLDDNINFPISSYEDIRDDLKYLEVVDYVLSVESLQRVYIVLMSTANIIGFFTKLRIDKYPSLHRIVSELILDKDLAKSIDKVVDEKGNIRENASPELSRIRKAIKSKQMELDKKFKSLINEYRKKGWLADTVETMRNGRRVLTVPSEHKRKIRGIIHDESATGKTTYIEPEPIITINNDIYDFRSEEKQEIYRILKQLSALLRPHCASLYKYQDTIVHYDMIQAKAQFGMKINGVMPKVLDKPTLGTIKGFHPLLFLKNKPLAKKTVPFDLSLHGKNRILVLSGPNAGGKSITMKSVGLLQLMLQASLLVPVDPESKMGVFESMFSDIGDSQSIEDDLSTYSSRLQNMRIFLENADDKSLLLIDEFGSGPDPKTGGAIAEAILKELNHRQSFGVITTHYSNLKMFAYKTQGIVNGAMVFDKDSLSPTYELSIGKPGSSYAFEIAEKSGLDNKVLKYARHKTGKNERAVDELLIDLQREKQELEEQIEKITAREKKLDKLIKTYENLSKDFEFKRKKLKLEAKEQALQEVAGNNKEFEKVIRELKQEKNLEKAKEIAAQVRVDRKKLVEDVSGLREDIYHTEEKGSNVSRPIEVGDFVRLKTGGATGKVESINKKSATVIMGIMTMTAKLRDLVHANEPLEIRSKKGIHTSIESSAKFESKLDIRGLRRDEALKTLETFVDKAIVSTATQLNIVHGKGDGILRQAVIRKLREYDAVKSYSHPEAKDGGDGVTIVELG